MGDYQLKKELRARMRALNRAIEPVARSGAAAAVFEQIERLPAFATAHCVALYCALADELPTEEWLAAWSERKELVLPRVEGDVMHFYRYDPARMQSGAFSILEPDPTCVRCDPAEIDLILVPGVAFTAAGARCGRGRGYYDKYLSQSTFRATKIGVCYAHQVVEELPVEAHDVAMEKVCFSN